MTGGLLIVGAGGHGRVVADAAILQGAWSSIAFLDQNPKLPAAQLGLPIIGESASPAELLQDYPHAVVAIGDSRRRLALMQQMQDQGFSFACVMHPSASVSAFCEVGAGSVVLAQAAINPGATLGKGCIINTGATVDHDCRLADGVHISPGAHLAGGVSVGRASWLGIGSSVRESVAIGEFVTVAAGAAVVDDIADHTTVGGVPAVPLRRRSSS